MELNCTCQCFHVYLCFLQVIFVLVVPILPRVCFDLLPARFSVGVLNIFIEVVYAIICFPDSFDYVSFFRETYYYFAVWFIWLSFDARYSSSFRRYQAPLDHTGARDNSCLLGLGWGLGPAADLFWLSSWLGRLIFRFSLINKYLFWLLTSQSRGDEIDLRFLNPFYRLFRCGWLPAASFLSFVEVS